MSKTNTNFPTINRIKQRAKKLKKERGISHSEALTIISIEYGFKDWLSFQKELKKNEQAQLPTLSPSTLFTEDYDVEMSEEDYELLDQEREDDLPIDVKKRVATNKKQLTKIGVEYSIFEPTMTGLKKSIIDATYSIRTHFELLDFHYYWEQAQGPDHKVIKEAYLLTDEAEMPSSASLYRPVTKNGDPRMWFKELRNFAAAGDQVAIVIYDEKLYLINLTVSCLEESLSKDSSHIKDFFSQFKAQQNSVSSELLNKLKDLAKTTFPALRRGDTAIGYTLETMLGITANSSKDPDYKGIELKSGRSVKTRTTLFAQVPNWDLSPCKRSAEILNKYGYDRGDDFKLNCTVSTQKENSQGLSFIYDEIKGEIQEWANKSELVAVWPGELLRKRLKEKHTETFWIEAKSELVEGVEQFQLIKVIHTKSPVLTQFIPLLQAGVVTMDHLIKRNGETNRVSEKGPLFKINKRDLDLLFPEPVTYHLI